MAPGSRLAVPVYLPAIGGWRMERDAEYFRRRANEERVAAMKDAHPRVREAHVEMARLYDEKLAAIAAAPQEVPLELPTVA